jgi:twitching motility two-component system response regulator PilG
MGMKRYKILIVEDEESLLKLESILLVSKGYKVSGVADGNSAMREIAAERHDVVILDVMLPGIDGFEVCRRIRSEASTRSIVVIMLTAKKNSQDMERGVEAGADAYITKPFKSAQLIGTIERLLQERNAG